jgi:murein DD-endopeptidase MepM/ murein hydrolase activator NlpD
MTRRKLLITMITVALAAVALGLAVIPASAEQRTLRVTLLGGKQVVVTVDAAPGTPTSSIALPSFGVPVTGVEDITPPTVTTPPVPTVPSTTGTPTVPTVTAPGDSGSGSGSSGSSGSGEPQGAGQEKQPTDRKSTKDRVSEADATVGSNAEVIRRAKAKRPNAPQLRTADGQPTPDNPGFSLALPGPAPIGVPNFFIDKFRIPPFLLPIYQAAGIQYGIRWEVLAAINEIETDYGRNLNVSSAGAVGWMQFMPSTWKQYGVDANRDGRKDPFNPVDSIFAAARYLRAAGGEQDLKRAVFAYNHADWYVDSVLVRAQLIGGLPADLVGSLTGLTQGHFPVHGKARYADDINEKAAAKRSKKANAAVVVDSNPTRRGINIFAKAGSPVIATNDGVIKKVGHSHRLGKYVVLQDVYGNTYTYGHLKKVAAKYPVPKEQKVSQRQIAKDLALPKKDPKPTQPATAGKATKKLAVAASKPAAAPAQAPAPAQSTVDVAKQRLFANPSRPQAKVAGGAKQLRGDAETLASSGTTFSSYFTRVLRLGQNDVVLKDLKKGSKVIAGTILGRIGKTRAHVAPHVLFEVRPAGRGAPRIDPKPILDGWKLLESTAIYRAAGKNPFFGPDAKDPSIGQILLMSKEALERRVLSNPRIDVYECGRRDIRAGGIDRRVLATLEFLAASGLKPTVTSLHCGHGFYTAGGNVSEHSSGTAVDIAKINGISILGHQGQGSITELTIRRLLTLQGTMKPHQIISLMQFEGADNTFSMGDHADHIHIGFRPLYGTNAKLGKQINAVLKPKQWIKLIDRLNSIDNPTVPTTPSKYSIKVKRASSAHKGE